MKQILKIHILVTLITLDQNVLSQNTVPYFDSALINFNEKNYVKNAYIFYNSLKMEPSIHD
jgi:hypothetical protein